jgi:hypothetical protein
MQASVTHRIRWPWWLVAVLAVALSAMWWWPSSDEAVVPMPPVAVAPTPVMPPAPKPVPVAAKPVDAALSVSAFKLVGTVVAADGVDSFALMRRTGDSQQAAGLELLEGEAQVDVSSAQQFFRMTAGVGRVSAQAAEFEVRYLDGRTRITCLQGQVLIEHPAGQRQLQGRQLAVYDSRSISEIAAADVDGALAWRRGEMVFTQAPLPAVLDEINRYRPGRVVLVGDAVRDKTVTARIRIVDIETALLQIQRSFDLSARSLPAGLLLLS